MMLYRIVTMEISHKDLPAATHNAIIQLEDHLWGPIASVIDTVYQDKIWRFDFSNFSEWMSFVSETYAISRARCWRYKKAGSYYNELRLNDKSLCSLSELPSFVSAEALEILERLERIAPSEITDPIKKDILRGEISIRTLKQTWEAYRPALHGVTNRGRGEEVLAAKVEDESRFEAESLLALSQNSFWSGINAPARCYIYPRVNDAHNKITYDALAIVQKSLDSHVEIHTFEFWFRTIHTPTIENKLPESYVDYRWIVIPDTDALSPNQVDVEFGLISVSKGELSIIRNAARIKHDATDSQPFMRDLLKLALRK